MQRTDLVLDLCTPQALSSRKVTHHSNSRGCSSQHECQCGDSYPHSGVDSHSHLCNGASTHLHHITQMHEHMDEALDSSHRLTSSCSLSGATSGTPCDTLHSSMLEHAIEI